MESCIDIDVWGLNNPVKDMNCWITNLGDLLIEVKIYAEPATLVG